MTQVWLIALTFLACGESNVTPPPVTPVAVPQGAARLIAGGDSRNDTAHVLPWVFREAKARGASAFLFLGDMELTPTLDAHFRQELDLLRPITFYPVLGNHEVKVLGAFSMGQAEAEKAFRKNFLDTAETPVRSSLATKVVYSVNLPGHVHFIALDNVSQSGFGRDQLDWLAKDLEAASADPDVKHIFVGMHKPLAHNGVATHGMDSDGPQALEDSDEALGLFQRSRVELILASHVHQFIQFQQGGIRSFITGGLGAPLNGVGPEHAFHHFLQIDVAGDKVIIDVIKFEGKPAIATEEDE